MKVCPVCGATYSDELIYCKNDGTDLVAQVQSSTAQGTPPAQNRSSAPDQKQSFLIPIIVGSVLVLVVLGWIVYSKLSPGSRSVTSAESNSSVASSSTASTSGTTSTPVHSSTPVPVAPVSDLSSAVSAIKSVYASSDAAYGRRDAQGHMAYAASEWTFVDKDGSKETRSDSLRYFEKRFSNTDPKRVVECHIETKVLESPAPRFENGDLVAVISVSANSTDAQGKHLRVSATQEDRWRKVSGEWKCVRSKIISRG